MGDSTLLDLYKGAMVGVHIGDAIGAPYETWKADKIAADIEARGGLAFFDYENPWKHELGPKILPAGRPTDDSDQTADLAYSLIECNGLDTEHLREALRDSVVRQKSRLWDGTALGAGGTTKKALSDDPEKVSEAMSNNIGTNGSLMRSVPMILWMFGNKHGVESYRLMSEMSKVTHAHGNCLRACRLYMDMIDVLLTSSGKDWVTKCLWGYIEGPPKNYAQYFEKRIAAGALDKDNVPIDPGAWPARGTAEFSLYVALWCFLHSTSFEDGIEKAVRVGGDTDTYAAIAGGLLGAYYGYEAIPLPWRQAILGHDVMVGYAEKLYEMSQT